MQAKKIASRVRAKVAQDKPARTYAVTLIVKDIPLGAEQYFTPEEICDAVQNDDMGAGVEVVHYSIAELKQNV